jgi:hypothetical protein
LSLHIFADESGDLGWSFDAPYGRHGSSSFLTIFAVCVDTSKIHHLERVVKDMYKAASWNTKQERKWTDARHKSRHHFAREAAKLLVKHSDISYHAVVAYKPNVRVHLREDADKLYNYMLQHLLVDEMAGHERVCLIPDGRSVKASSGNSLHDYLQTCLWYHKGAVTRLETLSGDSKHCKGLQFADFMAGAVSAGFENRNPEYLSTPGLNVSLKHLYFAAT